MSVSRFSALASSYVGRMVELREPVRGEYVGTITRVTAAGFRIVMAVSKVTVTRCDEDVSAYLN